MWAENVNSDIWTYLVLVSIIFYILITVFSVMTMTDLIEVPLVRGKLIFSQFSGNDRMKHFLGLQLWHLLKYTELTEIVRQNNELFNFFLYLPFLSWIFTIYRTAREEGSYFFNSSLPLSTTLQTLRP